MKVTSLLPQHIRGGGLGRFLLEHEVHPLMPAILLRMAPLDAFDLDA